MSTQPLQASDPLQIGAYRLVGRLGEGGMGSVFLGLSPGGRHVAVKVIRPEHAADPEFRARFAREVDAARKVGGFHTAPVVDADPYGDPPWMVTAYIPGPSLQVLIERGGPLTPAAVSALGAALAEGLGAIHACRLVHRDLKPGNVIMADDGPRIIDFGIVLAAGVTALTNPGTVIGTCSFMAPEQLSAGSVTPESDVFSLGCVLVYAATGRGPFDAATVPGIMHRVLNEPPNLGGLAGLLRETLDACLSKDPRRRPLIPDLLARFSAGSAAALDTAHDELATAVATVSGQLVAAPPGTVAAPQAAEVAVPPAETLAAPPGTAAAPQAAEVAVPRAETLAVRRAGALAEPGADALTEPGADAEREVNTEHQEDVTAGDDDAARHDNVSITQHANASPGGVIIQVAGNATIGDATLGTRKRAPRKGTGT